MTFFSLFQSRWASFGAVLRVAAVIGGFIAPSTFATTYYWDNNGVVAGFGTAGGTWAVSTLGNASQGWSTSSGGTLVPGNVTTAIGDDVNFGTATLALGAGTVTISGSVTNNSVTFATNSPITLTGGILVLGGAAAAINGSAANTVISSSILLLADTTINAPNVPTGTAAAVPFTLNGPISGAANLTFNGVQPSNAYGTIILNAPGDYQGSTLLTTVSSTGGANNTEIFVKLGTNNALPTNTVLTLDGGNGPVTSSGRYCELNLSGNNQTVAGLTNVPGRTLRVQRIVNSGATASTLTVNNTADYTFSGQLGWFAGQNGSSAYNNFGLAKSGTATFTLSGANAYTGPTTITGGTLTVGGAGRLGNGAYAGNITNNAAFNYASSAAQSLSGVMVGNGSLTQSGGGTLTLNGTDALPSNMVDDGVLSVSGTGNLTGSVSVNSGGTLSFTGGGRVNRVTVNSGGTVSLPGNGIATNLTFASTGNLMFDFSSATSVGSLAVTAVNGITNDGAASSITINLTGAEPANGTYTLINYSGSLGGSGFGAYKLGTAPVGKSCTLVNTAGAVQLTVTAGLPSVSVETKADGTGVVVPDSTVVAGTSITGFAIARDPYGVFLSNAPVTWVLTNITGAVASSNLVAAPDGKSAVYKPGGAGSARILAVASGANLVPSGTITSVGVYTRPFIWMRDLDKAGILARMATNTWAASYSNALAARVAGDVASHQSNRDTYLRGLPVNWSASPPSFNTGASSYGTGEDYFNTALDCAVLYYLTGNTNYARCAADILHNSVQAFQNLAPSTSVGNGGWLIPSDLLYEARQVGCQLPIVYDFLYQYLQANQVYDVDAAGMMNFSFPNAQYVFRTYYQLVRDHGTKDNNWSALMSTCMLNNLLALDSATERAAALQVYLTTGFSRQASLSFDYGSYPNPGDIWPESLQYSSAVGTIRTFHMVLLERMNPTLDLFGIYPNLPTSLPRIPQLRYPNTAMQISFGDGHRDDANAQPFFNYELVYQHALVRGYTNFMALFGGLLNGGVSAGEYTRGTLNAYSSLGTHNELLELLWNAPAIAESPVALSYPRTDALQWAGITLQRNPAPANNSTYGLMCFVGGAAHTHSHASGMSMELFGLGQVMGAKPGRDTYGTTIHEKYYRLFSANNTIVVNGASQGSGGWEGLGINTVQNVAMEPQPFAEAVSSNFSFTCSSFADTMGALAEGTQQRTLSIIRTSSTNGFYVDFFRSKSTVSNRVATTLNGNVTNQFHDYIYHNIGSTNISLKTNGVTLPLINQPSRFQNDIGDVYDQPGWRYFTNTVVSYPHDQAVRAQFNATPSGTTLYMDMILPAVTSREYARVSSPPIVDYSSADSPAVVVRQIGDAWDKPFAAVYEPHFSAGGSTVTDVTALWRSNIVVGLKIESSLAGKPRVHYIIANPNANETYSDASLGLVFKGRFGIVDDKGSNSVSLYLGQGSLLAYRGNSVSVVGATNSAAEVQFNPGQAPVISANAPVNTVLASAPTFTSISLPGGGVISLQAAGSNGVPYRLWTATNLAGGAWSVLNSGTVTNSPFVIQDVDATSNATRFYRLSTP